jgi:hypothetical protein
MTMQRIVLAAIAVASIIAATPLAAAKLPDTWDGLYRVDSKKMEGVYLLPQADFRTYTKVILSPTEIAFRKNWQRDQNQQSLANRVDDADARRILDSARDGFQDIFRKAYEKAGYQVVTDPGPNVLRILTAVVNLDVQAPDTMSAGITRTYSREAGSATLAVEARDSLTGALLGRAVDAQELDNVGVYIRNRATNSMAFEQVFEDWAKRSAEGLTKLKAMSPIGPAQR